MAQTTIIEHKIEEIVKKEAELQIKLEHSWIADGDVTMTAYRLFDGERWGANILRLNKDGSLVLLNDKNLSTLGFQVDKDGYIIIKKEV